MARKRQKWPPVTDPTEGPSCRKCGCRHLPVTHTKRLGKRIYRYRKCRHCGKNMTTVERATD